MANINTPNRGDLESLDWAVNSVLDRLQHIDTMGLAQFLMQPGSIVSVSPADVTSALGNNLLDMPNQALRERLSRGNPTIVAVTEGFYASPQHRFVFDAKTQQLKLGGETVDPHLLLPGADHGEMLVERLAASPRLAQLFNNFLHYHHQLQAANQPREESSSTMSTIQLTVASVGFLLCLVVFGPTIYRKFSHASEDIDQRPPITAPHIPEPEAVGPDPSPNRPNPDVDDTRDQIGDTLRKPPHQPPGGDGKIEVQGERLTSLETVLRHSVEQVDPNRNTHKDGLLDSYSVAKHFLGGKFIYRGRHADEKTLGGTKQPKIHRFALIGGKSGFYRNKNEKNLHSSTSIEDAINHLLDQQNLSDQIIKEWIVWTYHHSFAANLSLADLSIERNGGKVTRVTYGAAHPKVMIKERANVEGRAAGAQNSVQEVQMHVAIVDGRGNLLLPSGMTSLDGRDSHDLLVPSNLMPPNKNLTLTFDGAGGRSNFTWPMSAADLAAEAQGYLSRKGNGRPLVSGVVDGQTVNMHSTRQTVDLADGYADSLATVLTEGAISKLDEAGKITRFIQSRKYISEVGIGVDEDRPLILILFNSGGDCNNKLVPWTSMMARRKLDFSVIYLINPNSDKHESHVVGGVGASVFPHGRIPANLAQVGGFAPAELTFPGWTIGHGDTFAKFAIVGMDAYTFVPAANGQGGTWTVMEYKNTGNGHLQGHVVSTISVTN